MAGAISDTSEPGPLRSVRRAVRSLGRAPSARARISASSPSGFRRSGRRGSNPRPSAWEADALPTELRPRGRIVEPAGSLETRSAPVGPGRSRRLHSRGCREPGLSVGPTIPSFGDRKSRPSQVGQNVTQVGGQARGDLEPSPIPAAERFDSPPVCDLFDEEQSVVLLVGPWSCLEFADRSALSPRALACGVAFTRTSIGVSGPAPPWTTAFVTSSVTSNRMSSRMPLSEPFSAPKCRSCPSPAPRALRKS